MLRPSKSGLRGPRERKFGTEEEGKGYQTRILKMEPSREGSSRPSGNDTSSDLLYILVHVASFLGVQDLASLACTSRSWREVVYTGSSLTWKRLFVKRFGQLVKCRECEDWRTLYLVCQQLCPRSRVHVSQHRVERNHRTVWEEKQGIPYGMGTGGATIAFPLALLKVPQEDRGRLSVCTRLHNSNPSPILFRVVTDLPRVYAFHPCDGIIQGSSSVPVTISIKAGARVNRRRLLEGKHTFRVVYIENPVHVKLPVSHNPSSPSTSLCQDELRKHTWDYYTDDEDRRRIVKEMEVTVTAEESLGFGASEEVFLDQPAQKTLHPRRILSTDLYDILQTKFLNVSREDGVAIHYMKQYCLKRSAQVALGKQARAPLSQGQHGSNRSTHDESQSGEGIIVQGSSECSNLGRAGSGDKEYSQLRNSTGKRKKMASRADPFSTFLMSTLKVSVPLHLKEDGSSDGKSFPTVTHRVAAVSEVKLQCLQTILSYLSACDLGHLQCVSRQWKQLLSMNALSSTWRDAYQYRFGSLVQMLEPQQCRSKGDIDLKSCNQKDISNSMYWQTHDWYSMLKLSLRLSNQFHLHVVQHRVSMGNRTIWQRASLFPLAVTLPSIMVPLNLLDHTTWHARSGGGGSLLSTSQSEAELRVNLYDSHAWSKGPPTQRFINDKVKPMVRSNPSLHSNERFIDLELVVYNSHPSKYMLLEYSTSNPTVFTIKNNVS